MLDPRLNSSGFISLCCAENKDDLPVFERVGGLNAKVYRFSHEGQEYFFKEYLFRNLWKRRNVLFRGRQAIRIYTLLRDAGFRAPKVVCVARRGMRIFSVSESAGADCSIKEAYLDPEKWVGEDISSFRKAFGREVGRLHKAGFCHGDLRWGNVLVRSMDNGKPVFIFIDNDRTRKFWNIPARLRIKNLVQIRLMTISLERPIAEWDDFWQGYCEMNKSIEQRASFWLKKIERKTSSRLLGRTHK